MTKNVKRRMQAADNREQGIQAILFLQSLIGITEPRDKAMLEWDGMTASERRSTLDAYALMRPRRAAGETP